MPLTIKLNGKSVAPSHVLAKKVKAKKKSFDPQAAYRAGVNRSLFKNLDPGPQEQTFKLDPNVKGRGTGKAGITIGSIGSSKRSFKRRRSIFAGRN